MSDLERERRNEKYYYRQGWKTGFYWGIFLMGIFSIFVFIMTFLVGSVK